MLEDDFLKEKQNIREKMLKYSRAINQGKPLDDEFKDEFSSDDILRRRVKKKKNKAYFEEFDEVQDTKESNIYLKEDLINVKLEEKQSLALKILSNLSKKKEKRKNKKNESEKNEKLEKKTRKLFNFSFKKDKKEQQKILEKPRSKEISKETKKEFKKIEPTINEKNIAKTKPKEENTKEHQIQKPKISDLQKKVEVKDLELKAQTKPKPNPSNTNIKKQENAADLNEDNEITKNVLLEGFSDATKEDKNLNLNHLLFSVLMVSFSLFLFIPQIYIRNQIYYLSREIATLRAEENVLDEESKDLKRKLENMRFQNQILDYLE